MGMSGSPKRIASQISKAPGSLLAFYLPRAKLSAQSDKPGQVMMARG